MSNWQSSIDFWTCCLFFVIGFVEKPFGVFLLVGLYSYLPFWSFCIFLVAMGPSIVSASKIAWCYRTVRHEVTRSKVAMDVFVGLLSRLHFRLPSSNGKLFKYPSTQITIMFLDLWTLVQWILTQFQAYCDDLPRRTRVYERIFNFDGTEVYPSIFGQCADGIASMLYPFHHMGIFG